jgi:hypothetical protein
VKIIIIIVAVVVVVVVFVVVVVIVAVCRCGTRRCKRDKLPAECAIQLWSLSGRDDDRLLGYCAM